MEYIDVYRADGTRTGQRIPRNEPLPPEGYSLLVHIIICDRENRFLLQKRSMKKQYFPGIWDMTGGQVQAGESGAEGACREAAEEVGLRFEPSQLIHAGHSVTPWRNLFDIYYVKASFTLADCRRQEDEVDELALLPYHEAVRLLNKDPWYSGVLEDIARRIGAIE